MKNIVLLLSTLLLGTNFAFAGDPSDKLMVGILTNDLTLIDQALANGAKLNEMPRCSPRIAPASRSCLAAITEDRGYTPLIWALEYSNDETIQALVERGAKPDVKSLEARALQTLLEVSLVNLACETASAHGGAGVEELADVIGEYLNWAAFLWSGVNENWRAKANEWGIKARVLKTGFKDPFGNKLVVRSMEGPFEISAETAEAARPFTEKIPGFWAQFAPKR